MTSSKPFATLLLVVTFLTAIFLGTTAEAETERPTPPISLTEIEGDVALN